MNRVTTGTIYHSPLRRIGRLARISPGSVFYLKLLGIIVSGGRAARREAYTDERWIQDSRKVLIALESVGIRVTVENTASFIDLSSSCVFVSNHMSVLETFVLPGIIQPYRDTTFVVKESLLNYPFFGRILASRRPIVVSRTNPRHDLKIVLREGRERLGNGISVIIFPQTTRSPVFDPGLFNSIGVKLARRAEVPVIPIALRTDAWGSGRWVNDIGRISPGLPVHFSFGEPIPIVDDDKSIQRLLVRFISKRLRGWGAVVKSERSTSNIERSTFNDNSQTSR